MVEEYDRSGVQKYNPKPDFNLIPPFQRNSVSQSFLDKNPKYRDLFKPCPACSKNAFVDRDRHARKLPERKCRECGYTLSDNETKKSKSEIKEELKSHISGVLLEVEANDKLDKILKLVEQYYVLK